MNSDQLRNISDHGKVKAYSSIMMVIIRVTNMLHDRVILAFQMTSCLFDMYESFGKIKRRIHLFDQNLTAVVIHDIGFIPQCTGILMYVSA